MIAITLSANSTNDVLKVFHTSVTTPDIIELRIDLMAECDLRRVLTECPCPVIVTNRPTREGGQFVGSERDRIRVLRDAIDLGADYVDIEESAACLLGDRLSSSLIISHHDFSAMPEDMNLLRRRIENHGPDAIKVAGMAIRPEDALQALDLYDSTSKPTISIAMGEHGIASRVLGLRYSNCLLTYCAPDSGESVAPGQMTMTTMHDVYLAGSIGRQTRAIGIVSGIPLSDKMLGNINRSLRERCLDVVAVPVMLSRPSEKRVRAFADGSMDGLWVPDGWTKADGSTSNSVFLSSSEESVQVNAADTPSDMLSVATTLFG